MGSVTAVGSRERLADALNHRQPDRVPIDLGGSTVTGMHVSSVAALRGYYGLEKRPVRVHEPAQMLGVIDDDLKDAMGVDVTGIFRRGTKFGVPMDRWKSWELNGLEVLVPEGFVTTVDGNGDTLVYPEGDLTVAASGRMPQGGYFFDAIVRQEPFREEDLDPADNLEEYGEINQEDLDYLARQVEEAGTSRGVMAGFGGTALGDIANVPGTSLKHPKGIRDITEWYVSTRSRQDYIHKVFEGQVEIALKNLERIYAVVGDRVQVAYLCGTDFGTQKSTFCSEKTLRELYLPHYKRINDWIHTHTQWKTFKHTCGAVAKLLPALIDAGFDILNPVQCSAAGMEPEMLKERFGDRLVFWGGGVDTQHVLPFGTPEEVREQVLRRCEVFAKGGGFVFNPVHNVQARTPVENIVAMLNAVHEFNGETR